LVSNSARRGWEEGKRGERQKKRDREVETVLQHQTGVVDERRAVLGSRRGFAKE